MKNNVTKILIGIALMFTAGAAYTDTINFRGQLDIIVRDDGGAIYSGVPIGTVFSGAIDDVTFDGFISDGETLTPFTCCINAVGLEVANDAILDAGDAALLNSLAGTSFVAGDLIDAMTLESDSFISGGGNIEIGLIFVLDPLAFDDDSLDNYPPNSDDILILIFSILEEDALMEDIYEALGVVDSDTIDFRGQLDTVRVDNGGAVYSGVQIGTEFFIEIDLVTGLSTISDGTTVTPFTAFFENGSFFEVTNDLVLDTDVAGLLSILAGTSFVAGDLIDIIEIFGDAPNSVGGRIEIGVRYILDPLAFDDVSSDNYPPNPDDVLTKFFSIDERDGQDGLFYEGFGALLPDSPVVKKAPIAIFVILGQDEE